MEAINRAVYVKPISTEGNITGSARQSETPASEERRGREQGPEVILLDDEVDKANVAVPAGSSSIPECGTNDENDTVRVDHEQTRNDEKLRSRISVNASAGVANPPRLPASAELIEIPDSTVALQGSDPQATSHLAEDSACDGNNAALCRAPVGKRVTAGEGCGDGEKRGEPRKRWKSQACGVPARSGADAASSGSEPHPCTTKAGASLAVADAGVAPSPSAVVACGVPDGEIGSTCVHTWQSSMAGTGSRGQTSGRSDAAVPLEWCRDLGSNCGSSSYRLLLRRSSSTSCKI